jgi:hypothetical protein
VNVTITVAVRDDDGTTRSVEVSETSERLGSYEEAPARLVATRAMSRARKALDSLVPPDRAQARP